MRTSRRKQKFVPFTFGGSGTPSPCSAQGWIEALSAKRQLSAPPCPLTGPSAIPGSILEQYNEKGAWAKIAASSRGKMSCHRLSPTPRTPRPGAPAPPLPNGRSVTVQRFSEAGFRKPPRTPCLEEQKGPLSIIRLRFGIHGGSDPGVSKPQIKRNTILSFP